MIGIIEVTDAELVTQETIELINRLLEAYREQSNAYSMVLDTACLSENEETEIYEIESKADDAIEKLLAHILTKQISRGKSRNASPEKIARALHPSIRERRERIRKLLPSGLTRREIAEQLIIPDSTVKSDLRAMGIKLR